ncbi:hypothetical protein [Streptomyces sp. NBC_00299]|uniref:hypothetical protein n=1 Tax=Streptomyces sp. NBC_00299 TaxID=2975705 RepID=UPI002E2986D1|nr:hypothetical protein [Streptomyces sp. NBC_00299]
MHSAIPPEWNEANRAMWDERVPLHAAGAFHVLAGSSPSRSATAASGSHDGSPWAGRGFR